MTRFPVALSILLLAVLACAVTPPAVPTITATMPIPAKIAPSIATETPEQGIVTASYLWVRDAPAGARIASLKQGDAVTVISCADSWCKIEKPAGYVWIGCLDVSPAGLGCEAK